MTPHYADDVVTLYHGDCLDVLRELPDASADAVVTDPPYALEFMGKTWDGWSTPAAFQEWCGVWAAECRRVLKPGGHLLAFGGSRTWHRLAAAVEDAGYEIRDSIAWLYGSGFPKSLDVSKAIDKAAGAERSQVIGKGWHASTRAAEGVTMGRFAEEYQPGDTAKGRDVLAPATPDAERWQGWGTALKPAFEPIVVARKPLAAGTVAGNVLAHGTGALNIDACRVQMSDADRARIDTMGGFGRKGWTRADGTLGEVYDGTVDGSLASSDATAHDAGRWPANVVLDDSQAAELDRQSGTRPGMRPAILRRGATTGRSIGGEHTYGSSATVHDAATGYDDTGGASRFFPTFRYQPKAPTAERPTYVKDGEAPSLFGDAGSIRKRCTKCGRQEVNMPGAACTCPEPDFQPDPTMRGKVAHPTVKPLDLMRWLVRLVTPPGGVVLDPFAGSGTTAEACAVEGLRCVAIEREADYLPLVVARMAKPIQLGLDLGV